MKGERVAELSAVTKTYGKVVGVQDIQLEIGSGITGVIGPNGSGKTTLIKLLLGLIKPDRGNITVFNNDPCNNPTVQREIGWCPESTDPLPWLTPRQYLTKMLKFYDPVEAVEKRVEEVAEIFDLNQILDRKNDELSPGLKQRVKLARTFIHKPDFAVLDEPLQALDLPHRGKIRDFFKNYVEQGKSILYASHLLFEVERVCDHLAFLYNNSLIAHGSISEIRKRLFQFPHHIRIKVGSKFRPLLQAIVTEKEVNGVDILRHNGDQGVLEVKTRELDRFLSKIPSVLLTVDADLIKLQIQDFDLRSVYTYLSKAATDLSGKNE